MIGLLYIMFLDNLFNCYIFFIFVGRLLKIIIWWVLIWKVFRECEKCYFMWCGGGMGDDEE